MRILIHGINYAPELTGIGKYTGEMAAWLASRGHRVRVVTALPYYPAWQVAEGYKAWCYGRERISGVGVLRCPLWVPAKPTGLKRLLHLATFTMSSFPVILGQAFFRPDLVMVIEPPFSCAPQAWLTAKLCGAKAWLHIQDFEVDAAFELGLLRHKALKRLVAAIERWWMRRFDRVSTISPRMMDRLSAKGVPRDRQVLFPNWVNTDEIYPLDHASAFRKEIGIPEQGVVALYSGNMGQKQGLEIVIEAARHLEGDKNIHFVLCGQGAAYHHLRDMASGLANIHWLPLQPASRLNELLNLADIHLLPQRADAADLVMPSKLTGMLASGRPVLATARKGTQVAEVLKEAGMVIPPGNAEKLATALKGLAQDPETRNKMGKAARRYAVEFLERDVVLSRFEKEIVKLLSD